MNLFEQNQQPAAVSYRKGNDTSRAGAEHAREASRAQFAQYIKHLKRCGAVGMTDNEASVLLGLPPSTVSARRGSREGRAQVVDSGKRRRSLAGVQNKVWVLREFAPAVGAGGAA